MNRTLIGYFLGAGYGLLLLAALGVVAGLTEGGAAVARPHIEPGPYAALLGAFVYTAYFGWLAGLVGGLIGALAGLGSWLVRPRASGPARRARI
jgi:ABC-type antimicrobial peptide transport system permease subunit